MKTFLLKIWETAILYSLVIYVALLALVVLGFILYANTDDTTYLILSAIFFWIGANFKWIGTISVLEGNAKKFQIIICTIFNVLMVVCAMKFYTELSPYLN